MQTAMNEFGATPRVLWEALLPKAVYHAAFAFLFMQSTKVYKSHGFPCQYCGKSTPDVMMVEKPISIVRIQVRLQSPIRLPLCGPCFKRLADREIHPSFCPSDIVVARAIDGFSANVHGYNENTQLNKMIALGVKINELEKFMAGLRSDFLKKASEAQMAIDKMEIFWQKINTVKSELAEKCGTTYEACRDAANKAIADSRLRKQVFERDGHRCKICKRMDCLSIDHIIPVSKGGTNDLDNLQTLCRPCNSAKGESL
jgi:hypothetical protein